eukprot:11058838-Ditylum_brightwellii.AAC.1
MTRTERGNVKTSPSHVTRDVTVQGNVTKASKRKSIVTIIVFVIMVQKSATLCKPAGSTFGPCTIIQSRRGSGRSGLLRMPKGEPKGTA